MMFNEIGLGPISQGLKITSHSINPDETALLGMHGAYISEYDELWFSVPLGSSEFNNVILVYKDGVWTKRNISAYAIGAYHRVQSWTWDTLPYETWDEWAWPQWDYSPGQGGFPIDLVSDASGYTWAAHLSAKDAGESFTATFTLSTDLANKQSLSEYKRIYSIQPFFQAAGDATVGIYIKRDGESSWQYLGDVDITGSGQMAFPRLPTSKRARHFLVRFDSQSPFRFLGVVFEFEFDGDR
jgi:hypothetical protein